MIRWFQSFFGYRQEPPPHPFATAVAALLRSEAAAQEAGYDRTPRESRRLSNTRVLPIVRRNTFG
jgi:hypothetical protein